MNGQQEICASAEGSLNCLSLLREVLSTLRADLMKNLHTMNPLFYENQPV